MLFIFGINKMIQKKKKNHNQINHFHNNKKSLFSPFYLSDLFILSCVSSFCGEADLDIDLDPDRFRSFLGGERLLFLIFSIIKLRLTFPVDSFFAISSESLFWILELFIFGAIYLGNTPFRL